MTSRVVLVTVLASVMTGPAWAKQIRFIPVAERVGSADAVVLGNVVEIEPDPVEVEGYAGSPKRVMHVASVKVTEALLGADGLTHVRVGFVRAEDQPADGQHIWSPALEKGNDVLLFLRKRLAHDFYDASGHFAAAGRLSENKLLLHDIEKVLEAARPLCKILADPKAGLAATAERDRMLTAWMLVTRYRALPADVGGSALAEAPVPAAESKLILENLPALAKADPDAFRFTFHNLGLTKADGFEGGVHGDGGQDRALKWLTEYAARYRIKRYVVEKKR